MLLAIDIGNSNIAFGIYKKKWIHHWRASTIINKTADEYEVLFRALLREIKLEEVQTIIISSVVPQLAPTIQKMARQLFHKEPIMMNAETYTGLDLMIDHPNEIGADLVANAVAGYNKFKTNCIIVDFGTALSITVVSKEQKILGVSIAPGLESAVKALFSNTAQLPAVQLLAPPCAIGKNTTQAIQSGIVIGYTGLVEKLVHEIKKELNDPETKVVATGGMSEIIAPGTPIFDAIEPWLTLDGLRLISQQAKRN